MSQPRWQPQPQQPQWQAQPQWQPPNPRPAKDPKAWRAAVFATVLGAPATALTGLTMIVEALIRGTCDQDPGRVCGGLPDGGVYAGLYGCVAAFGGSLTLVLVLNRVDQRAWRWFWACAAVVLPLAIMAVAIGVGRKS